MSFESRLRKETPQWVAAGIVTAEQAQRIEARHPEGGAAAARRFLAIVVSLGAVLCVVGLALIISANWEHIHRWVKLVALVSLLVAANGFGLRLKSSPPTYPRSGDALLMAAAVMFLLGIALVSQIYHLGGRPGTAVLVWGVGIAAVPFLTRSGGAFFVLLVAVYTWLVIESAEADGWLRLAADRHRGEAMGVSFVLLAGSLVLYWSASLWSPAWRTFASLQRAWPVVVVCAGVYAAGFGHKGWWASSGVLPRAGVAGWLLVAGAAGLIAAKRDWLQWRRLSPSLILAAAPAVIVFSGVFGEGARVFCAVVSWMTLVALNVFMARTGLEEGKPWLVNVAIAFIALNLFTRYFDIFSSMLDQGMMFLVSGVLVLAVGWFLERKRRSLLAAMRRGGAA